MDWIKIQKWIVRYGLAVLTAALGLILVIKPDTAAILAAKVVGWVMILLGAQYAICTARGGPDTPPSRWITAAAELAGGILFVTRPLLLANVVFRCVGFLLCARGFVDLRLARRSGIRQPVVPVITLVCGALLVLIPLSLSRLLVRIVGIVILALGVLNILDQRKREKLTGGGKPDIIDAE